MPSELTAVLYGLTSALTWGAGDFSGGLATKRTHVMLVVLVAQGVGIVCLLGTALLVAEPLPSGTDVLIGAAAGIAGMMGLLAYYQGLAQHPMGIVAPVAAVVSAIVPVIVGAFLEGLPAMTQLFGFALAILAVWMISHAADTTAVPLRGLLLPVVAGGGFALFFICIDQTSHNAVFWPLVGARTASLLLLALAGWAWRQWQKPSRHQLPVMVLAGIFDTAGNAFYTLAATDGRLDIAAVLASLYPATTVLLAWFVLNERLNRQQWVGVVVALCAVGLIAL